MREIKFRAWDKRKGEWYYSDSLGLEKFFARATAEASSYYQYVGLKDVRGMDIYEGDSVRRKRPCFKANGSKNGSVIDDLEVRFIQDGRGRNGFNLVSSAYCEVIGSNHGSLRLVRAARKTVAKEVVCLSTTSM